jgi:subtilisin family serine protease
MHLKKTIPIALAVLTLLFSCKKQDSSIAAPPDEEDCVQAASAKNGTVIDGKFIVAYDPGVVNARSMSKASLESYSEDVLQRNNIAPEVIENTFAGEPGGFIANLSADEVAKLRADASVLAIEPDRVVALALCFTVAAPSLITWNIHRTGYGNGIGKTAWVIDTGVDFDHPDLTVDVTRSRSFISNELTADDQNGHGTHVAGIIGGMNNDFGVLGVASGATIVPLKVLNQSGVGSTSAIIQALGYINTNAAAGDVVNMSLGEDTTSAILIQQVQNTAARGIYIAIAAGNDHQQANRFSPGNANGLNIYTVSAIDSLDNFAGFSNYGNDVVDYAAPGVRILSTYIGGRYAYMSGTSMATPHMAGLLLLRGRNITTSGFARNDPDGTADPIAHY